MVWAVRLERTACGFQVRHSTKLSYAQTHLSESLKKLYGRAVGTLTVNIPGLYRSFV